MSDKSQQPDYSHPPAYPPPAYAQQQYAPAPAYSQQPYQATPVYAPVSPHQTVVIHEMHEHNLRDMLLGGLFGFLFGILGLLCILTIPEGHHQHHRRRKYLLGWGIGFAVYAVLIIIIITTTMY